MTIAQRHQRTIASTATVRGIGYWSGEQVNVEFRPARPSSGIRFVRMDLPSRAVIPAAVAYRRPTPRRTTLATRAAHVEMVEHVLAALAGMNIDNCDVCVDRPELPGMDGSAQPFVDAIVRAGIVPVDAVRRQLIVDQRVRVEADGAWIEARPAGAPGLTVRYELDYAEHRAIGRQSIELAVTPQAFQSELAPSRTFLLRAEARWLQAQGRAQHVSPRELLVFDEHGPIQNQLRFTDECVRHKALDVVGDLALAGMDICAHVVCHRSGHQLNAELVSRLLAQQQQTGARRRSA